ncbi:type VI secretion system ImpA family N-terminal domain-containing protein [Yoonia sp. SS1-5]|uniref:ImpA family type VI secretion system protein n=1 Tax=Yoonia rhodophyticola TaxID=3137370 RepID=A0AAN0ME04_9RHOB
MSYDWMKEPISADASCGPDLEAADDAAFVDYYYEAESRMPERYFTPGIKAPDDEFTPGTVFDPKSIDHKSEKETINGLLKRSRDIRLLSLLARLMILAGRLPDFADAVDGLALALETHPNDVHPQETSDRRGAIDELGGSTVVGQPLQYANLAGPGEVTYRRHLVATGQSEPREGEVGLNAGTLMSEIAAPGNKQHVDAAHAALTKAADALHRIKSACLRLDAPFTPSIDATQTVIANIQTMMQDARNDLTPWSAEGASTDDDAPATDTDAPSDDAVAAAPGPAPAATTQPAPAISTSVPNRAAALQTLTAVESYLATNEPAAPSLLLVTQARLLVGRPLIEAIETLMPEHANQTKITFGSGSSFVLYMDRLKMLAGEGANQAAPAADAEPGPVPDIPDRTHVAPLISAVEEYFRVREPASPIPVLLSKARTYLDKDFAAIVADLLPPKGDV